jgi:hypothetical protein
VLSRFEFGELAHERRGDVRVDLAVASATAANSTSGNTDLPTGSLRINLRTAKALDITIPRSVLVRANELIE